MRSVSFRARTLVVLVLLVVLMAPVAVASDEASAADASLWSEFLAWIDGRIGIPPGESVDDDGFTAWLMARITIPTG
jgi:hypothetical protein